MRVRRTKRSSDRRGRRALRERESDGFGAGPGRTSVPNPRVRGRDGRVGQNERRDIGGFRISSAKLRRAGATEDRRRRGA